MRTAYRTPAIKSTPVIRLLFIGMFSLFVSAKIRAQETLTNQNIISLTEAKVSNSVIMSKVKTSTGNYDLSSSGIVDLKKAKVSEGVIEQMMTATSKLPALTNTDVIDMCKAGVSRSLVSTIIKKSPGNFDLSTDGLIQLKTEKVPDPIVKDMMTAKPATAVPLTPAPTPAVKKKS